MSNVTKNVVRMLEEKGVEYKLLEHEPVYTSEQAAQVRGVSVQTGVKALVLKTKDGRFILALVRADKRADLKAVAAADGTKKVKLADPADVLKITGCEIGSVPPFGHETELKTYLDKDILEQDEVNFNIGEHTKSVRMKAQDLLKVIKPVLI
jgi:Ala-tRNA(Pro) deacylase